MSDWPALPYEEWRETRDTLHMYAQVVGKLHLAFSPIGEDIPESVDKAQRVLGYLPREQR